MTTFAATRPDRGPAMDEFLARIGWAGAARAMLAGDASFRRYERVTHQGIIAVLMDAPPPWEDVRPFLAVTRHLAACGLSVPDIIAADETAGFLLLEDLGDASFTRMLKAAPAREAELYTAATQALIRLYRESKAHAAHFSSTLPPYDMTVYLREAALLVEWFLPQIMGTARASALREDYLALWRAILTSAGLKQSCLVHRDYHADNLFWLEERAGHAAVGMIDYQDALWGDPAYDMASLLEDARRDVSAQTAAECLALFARETGEEALGFSGRYAVLAAQRNAKIIGIFCRLAVRDGKAHYTDYLPRVWGHFLHDLRHPLLAPMRKFIDAEAPPAWRGAFVADISVGGVAP